MHLVEPDPAFVASFGLLHGNVEPVLLFNGITSALVVAGLIGLVVQLAVGIVQPLAEQRPARRAAHDGVGIFVGKLAAEGSSTRSQPNISGGAGDGSAAGEQRTDGGEQEELNEQ